MTNFNICQIINFDIQLDYSGGTFSFAAVNSPAFIEGSPINLYGLIGTITGVGEIVSNGQVGALIKGIFGNRNLNKQLNLLGAGNTQLYAYLTNSLLSTQQENTLSTFEGAARAIAELAGINLTWNLPGGDIPLVNFTVQEGETAISALSSLSSQFGGVLLWDGGNSYTIAPPNQYAGLWQVPDKSVIAPAGIQYMNNLDLGTNIYGTGIFSVPIETYFDPTIYGLPATIPLDVVTPKVQTVKSFKTVFTANDPAAIFTLPLDTEEVWVQFLARSSEPAAAGNAGNSIPNTGNFNPSLAVTADPNYWVSLGSPGVSNSNVPLTRIGGALGAVVPQVNFSNVLFPANVDSINNGNFVCNVGITRNNQSQLFEAAVASRNQQVQAMLARLIGSFRYVSNYQGSINSYFFGSIPLPGMWGSANVCGTNVEGVISSVSFTFPGLITVQVNQYAYINFIKNFYYLDFLTNTGISTSNPNPIT